MSDPQIHQPMAPPKAHTRQQRSTESLPYVTAAENRPGTPSDGNTQLTIKLQEAEITALRAENLKLGEENLKLAGELVKTSKSLESSLKLWIKAEDELERLLKRTQGILQKRMCAEKEEGRDKEDTEDTEDMEDESGSGTYEDALDALDVLDDLEDEGVPLV